MDLAVSAAVLVLGSPAFLIIPLLIRLDSKGPILYRTERVGENGKLFTMLKFRTMVTGADKLQDQVTTYDDEGRPVYKTKDDPRVTRIGKILRRTSLDELPQFINVLKGEMSVVGPRPEQPFIAESYEDWQWQRLTVPPGITGLWQVSGRSDMPLHLNTRTDIQYARNYSLFLDIKILFKTVGVVLRGKGAY
jgi:lipopolysaccharide/colanic/teichoic acid biosynthesis glycosyltransferase